jgi:hypothetical protein
MDLTDLKDLGGKDNTPGLQGVAYFAPLSAFTDTGIKEVDPTDGVTITGPHVFKPAEGFTEIYVTLDSNEYKLETQGERDSRGKKPSVEFFHPGNTKEAAIFDRVAKNQAGILIIVEPDGTQIQLGTRGLPIEVSGSYGSGKLSGGRKGWTFTAEGYQVGQQFYEGVIPLKRDAAA